YAFHPASNQTMNAAPIGDDRDLTTPHARPVECNHLHFTCHANGACRRHPPCGHARPHRCDGRPDGVISPIPHDGCAPAPLRWLCRRSARFHLTPPPPTDVGRLHRRRACAPRCVHGLRTTPSWWCTCRS